MEIQDERSLQTIYFINKLDELTSRIRDELARRSLHLNGEKYMTTEEICTSLHISSRTIQTLRDTRQIGYVKISGKILYKQSDILKLLEDNYVPANNNITV